MSQNKNFAPEQVLSQEQVERLERYWKNRADEAQRLLGLRTVITRLSITPEAFLTAFIETSQLPLFVDTRDKVTKLVEHVICEWARRFNGYKTLPLDLKNLLWKKMTSILDTTRDEVSTAQDLLGFYRYDFLEEDTLAKQKVLIEKLISC